MSTKDKSPEDLPELQPADFGPHWNTNYYEILQDYYWDPQHLDRGRLKPPRFGNDKKVLWHIHQMEVSLNHLLALFFSLAPRDFIQRLELAAFGSHSSAAFRQVSLFELRTAHRHDPTQPDVFLVSTDRCLSIEVKIDAKSGLEQVAKYALLHLDFALRNGIPADGSRLIYLTPRPVSKTWKEKFPDVAAMRCALADFYFANLLSKAKVSREITPAGFKAAALAMPVAHLTFADFYHLAADYAATLPSDATPPVDTAAKLFAGLLHELSFRHTMLNLSI